LRSLLLNNADGTKLEIAESGVQRFLAEFATRLPPKRKPWVTESYQMAIFEAAAVALVFRMNQKKQTT